MWLAAQGAEKGKCAACFMSQWMKSGEKLVFHSDF
jgi:hypothetical protein